MQRLPIAARPNWLQTLTEEGVLWTTTENGSYWSESMEQPVYYKLTVKEQESLEHAANTIHGMCLDTLEWLFEVASDYEFNYWMDKFQIPVSIREKMTKSWFDDEWGFYGRFDFIMTKQGPKLLEYNADTPTTLIESSVSQWNWFVDNNFESFGYYQFNGIHEAMVQHWKDMHRDNHLGKDLHITGFAQLDDYATIAYVAETAKEAGLEVKVIDIETIGVDNDHQFVDSDGYQIRNCFKLYPYEFLLEDEYGVLLPNTKTRFIEPMWKMVLSNKAILALLWDRYPDCEYLVPAYFDLGVASGKGEWVKKPLLSREGSNITFIKDGQEVGGSDGPYGDHYVYQQKIEWETVDGKHPMLGVWMVGSDAVGLGIREDDTLITQNNSRFIPHVVG